MSVHFPSKRALGSSRYRLGLVGARGYVGREFIDLLAAHPQLELAVASSRELAGKPVHELAPHFVGDLSFTHGSPHDIAKHELDVVVLALPNGMSRAFIEAVDETCPHAVVIDLSADQRFSPQWEYGLPERNRTQLRGSKRIANPGCYATGIQMGLHPLLGMLDAPVPVFGVSGYSGAGTTPSPKNDPEHLHENLLAYGFIGHVHEKEVSHQLSHPIHFMPHVASWFRGIHLTLDCQLAADRIPADWQRAGDAVTEAIVDFFQDAFRGEALVRVQAAPPLVRNIQGQHHVEIGGFSFSMAQRRLAFCVTLDNLLKGAATQALQNVNLALGLEERLGIPAPEPASISPRA